LIQFNQWPWGLAFFVLYLVLHLLVHPKQPALRLPDTGGFSKPGGRSGRFLAAQGLPWLRLLVVMLLGLALSRPQFGQETVQTHQPGKAILMVLDRSSSMLDPMIFQGAEHTRLAVVKQVFEDFVSGSAGLAGRPNDRIGLITFAGFVDEVSPLTLDHQSLVHFVRSIQPAQRFEDGTMIGDALTQASLRMVAYQGLLGHNGKEALDLKSKIVILLTDGQQSRGGIDLATAAKTAQENGAKVYTIAIVGEAPTGGFGSFFKFNNPFLDTSLIEEVARVTGGAFFKVTTGEALSKVYAQIDQLEKTEFEEKRVVYQEKYRWFLLPGVLLLALELGLRFGPLRQLP